MNRSVLVILALLTTSDSAADERSAEQLVASKERADVSYRQLMEAMGSASALIHAGILRQNKLMVEQGAQMIADHPAPNHKPWTIVAEGDRAAFKQALLSHEPILHTNAERAAEAAARESWLEAAAAAEELTRACVGCHLAWKEKARTAR